MNLAVNYTRGILSESGFSEYQRICRVTLSGAYRNELANERFRLVTLPGLRNFDLQNFELLEVPI